jgi:hypothetical protein
MSTVRDRVEEHRQEMLASMHDQVANGSLVIRQMTDEERRMYPPRPTDATPRRPRNWLSL